MKISRRAALLVGAGAIVGLRTLDLGVHAAEPGTLIYSWPSNVGPLNPHLYAPNQMFGQSMVYEPLVRYVEGGTIEPWLAKTWSISDDGRSCTFSLRTDVSFSDGTPFNAGAVKANFDTVLLNRARHDWLELINQLQHVSAVDEFMVRIDLKDPYYPILLELALVRPVRFLAPSAFPDNANTADGIKAPIGTGPWKLTSTVKGEHDVFERNSDYWGTPPKLERILVKVVPDPNTRALALETGDIDLAYGTDQLGADAFARFQADPSYKTDISPALASRVIALNSSRGPTRDLAVRRAIQHAVDGDAIVANVLLGLERPASTLFSSNFPYTNIALKPYAPDLTEAARVLDEAGWALAKGAEFRAKEGQELALDLCFVGSDALQKAIAEAVQGDLRKVGIAANLFGEDDNAFYSRQQSGDFGMIFGDTWGAPYDPHSFMSSMRVPAHADYQAQLGLPMKGEIDKKIGEVLVSTDENQRRALYTELLTTLHEQAVYLPISYTTATFVARTGIENVTFGPTQYEIPWSSMSRAS